MMTFKHIFGTLTGTIAGVSAGLGLTALLESEVYANGSKTMKIGGECYQEVPCNQPAPAPVLPQKQQKKAVQPTKKPNQYTGQKPAATSSAKKSTAAGLPCKPCEEIDALKRRVDDLENEFNDNDYLVTLRDDIEALREDMDALSEAVRDNGGQSPLSVLIQNYDVLIAAVESYGNIVRGLHQDDALNMARDAFRRGPLRELEQRTQGVIRDCRIAYTGELESAKLRQEIESLVKALEKEKNPTAKNNADVINPSIAQSEKDIAMKKRLLVTVETKTTTYQSICKEQLAGYASIEQRQNDIRDEIVARAARNLTRRERDTPRVTVEVGPEFLYDGAFAGALQASVCYLGQRVQACVGAAAGFGAQASSSTDIDEPARRTSVGQDAFETTSLEGTSTQHSRYVADAVFQIRTTDLSFGPRSRASMNLGLVANYRFTVDEHTVDRARTSTLEVAGVQGEEHRVSDSDTEKSVGTGIVPQLQLQMCYVQRLCGQVGAGVNMSNGVKDAQGALDLGLIYRY